MEFRKKNYICDQYSNKIYKMHILKKSELNFVLKDFKKRANKSKKTIDLLIYYRKHENKFLIILISFKVKLNLKQKGRYSRRYL